ncbi:S41 family peptidase [Megasphaera hutchinsoni]|nr:S41 family peptidase [Megasphaera genomosp. type_2]
MKQHKNMIRIIKQYQRQLKLFLGGILVAIVGFVGGTLMLSYWLFGSAPGMFLVYKTVLLVRQQFAGNVDGPVVLENTLRGIVQSTGDPYSRYFSAREFDAFKKQLSASYGGIGVLLGEGANGRVQVTYLVDTVTPSPAKQAGLQRGDEIIAINKQATTDWTIEKISEAIRGLPGTPVRLTILRQGQKKDVSLTRQALQIKQVKGTLIAGSNVGYIRIFAFGEDSGKEFTQVYRILRKQGMKMLILDLRNNPGGLIQEAVAVSSNFVPKNSTILSFSLANGKEQTFRAAGTKELIPMAVLMNKSSASASEIVAGDIQDLHLGKVVGTPSFGKGSVQTVYPLADKGVIKLTIARYKTNKGREIHLQGITPDVVVQEDPLWRQDLPLQAAYRLLSGKKQKAVLPDAYTIPVEE